MPAATESVAALFARSDQLRQAERRAASARVASVIGHLIGTPLNVIAGRAALIRTNHTSDAVLENVRRIEEQVERLAQRIRRLIDYLGVADLPAEPRSVESVLAETLALYEPVAEEKGVSIQSSHGATALMNVDGQPSLLVLTCLLSLAMRTTPVGGIVTLVAMEHSAKAVMFELLLPGLDNPPTRVDRLEPPDEGTGYDSDAMQVLSICLGIARRSGGSLDISPAAGSIGVRARFECARI